jgi:hypothetical protein
MVRIATSFRLDGPGSNFPVFPVFHSFYFLTYYLLPYVFMFLHFVNSVLMLLILYSVLLMYYCICSLHFLSNTATGYRPNCSS